MRARQTVCLGGRGPRWAPQAVWHGNGTGAPLSADASRPRTIVRARQRARERASAEGSFADYNTDDHCQAAFERARRSLPVCLWRRRLSPADCPAASEASERRAPVYPRKSQNLTLAASELESFVHEFQGRGLRTHSSSSTSPRGLAGGRTGTGPGCCEGRQKRHARSWCSRCAQPTYAPTRSC